MIADGLFCVVDGRIVALEVDERFDGRCFVRCGGDISSGGEGGLESGGDDSRGRRRLAGGWRRCGRGGGDDRRSLVDVGNTKRHEWRRRRLSDGLLLVTRRSLSISLRFSF